MQTAIQSVHDTSINLIAEVRTREKQLVDEVHNLYGQDTVKLMERKDEIHTNLEGINH